MRIDHRSKSLEASTDESNIKLMASGLVCPQGNCAQPVEVVRGMLILSKDGQELGKVAAVVLDSKHHKTTHVLLSRLPEKMGYWLVPVLWFEDVNGGSLRVSLSADAAASLREWHSS